MESKYHYEYMLVCVDMCNGGAKYGPFKTKFDAILHKPSHGIWDIRKVRKYERYGNIQ